MVLRIMIALRGQLGRVVMAQVSGPSNLHHTCSKERGFESLSCQPNVSSFAGGIFCNMGLHPIDSGIMVDYHVGAG